MRRRGIEAATSGAKLGDVSAAIAGPARAAGFGLLAEHGGHGIGRAMHEDPPVADDGRSGRGFRLRPGVVIGIEPQLIAGGGDGYREDHDGWTVRTDDGNRAAHSEHTVAIT